MTHGFPEQIGNLKIYIRDNGVSMADAAGWLPGSYDTRDTAIAASRLTYAKLCELEQSICHFDRGNRNITLNDLPK